MPTATARFSSTTGESFRRGEQTVEAGYLRPARLGPATGARVAGGDVCLQLVGTSRDAHDLVQDSQRLAYGVSIPERAVLGFERDEVSGGADACGLAGIVEEHECEETPRLSLVWHELNEQPGQPYRLLTEFATNEVGAACCRVPFVEDEVDDRQHGVETVGELICGRDTVRDAGVADLAFCADDALLERCLWDQEGARDLGRRKAADGPKRERDLGLRRKSRMAAGEDEAQAVI